MYLFEVAAFELAHRRELLVVASSPLGVHERESEHGTTYLASTCDTTVSEVHDATASTGARLIEQRDG